jgi:hypothetical protein
MKVFSTALFALLFFFEFAAKFSLAQVNSASQPTSQHLPSTRVLGSSIALRVVSTMNVASELGGAFMIPSKCGADGNLYIRKLAVDRPLLGPVVKIDADGKRTALFDPAAFSKPGLDRADAFSPAADGGMYQIAQSGILKPHSFVLHFFSDGSVASPVRLDADFEVYTFAAFTDGNFLVSGVKRDVRNKDDRGHNFTAVFSPDGRELAQLSFPGTSPDASKDGKALARAGAKGDEAAPMLDLADAEVGSDGNLYVMRGSTPALVYVIAPSGEIVKTIKVPAALAGAAPTAFHVSGNRLAIAFRKEDSERPAQTIVVADAQTGRRIAAYADATGEGTTFVCYSANDGVFTFLKLGEGNALEVIRAEAQ